MPRFHTAIAAVVFMTFSATLAAAGGADAGSSGDDWLRSRLGSVSAGMKVQQIQDLMQQIFNTADVDGGGVSARDHELAGEIAAAQQRAQRIHEKMTMDLDGDSKVTREELSIALGRRARQPMRNNGVPVVPTDEQAKAVIDRLTGEALVNDANKDGVLDLAEMGALPPGRQYERLYSIEQQNAVPLGLDANGDRVVTREEFDAGVTRVIASLDADSDGVISAPEASSVQATLHAARQAAREEDERRRQKAEAGRKAEICTVPKPSPAARVVQIGAYEGKTLSNVALGDDDIEVSAAWLDIEKGDTPLYVVASSYEAMIWKVTGAAERIERIVVSSAQRAIDQKSPRAGVAGVTAGRVTVVPQHDCIRHFTDTKNAEAVRSRGELNAILGRPVDDQIGLYGVGKISLPSGIASPDAQFPETRILPKTGPAAGIWASMLHYQPGGLADLEPAGVVSTSPAKSYGVLPQAAGLAQLVEEGALEVAGSQRVREFGGTTVVGDAHVVGARPTAVYSIPGSFRIVKKMRFPAGLNGAHSVSFILGKGVPPPDGSAGHSSVVSEETGEPVMGRGVPR